MSRPLSPFKDRANGRALVAGRFDPPHRGHEYVIELARRTTDRVTVAVFTSPRDAVPGFMRARWLRQLFTVGGPDVVEVRAPEGPVAPPKFAELVSAATRTKFEWLFSSEADAAPAAAKALGAVYVPVDPKREAIATSGREIRADVMKRFDDLVSVARPWFVRRVAVVGAESTGKSTLCRRLAQTYGTVLVAEQLRVLADARGGDLDVEAFEIAARAQAAAEDALARQAQRLLFCDTDLVSIHLWSERLFGASQAELADFAGGRPYDLTLHCAADVPFVGAPSRDEPEQRAELDARLRERLEGRGHVVELRGSWEKRLLDARKAVDQLLARKGFLSARGEAMLERGEG